MPEFYPAPPPAVNVPKALHDFKGLLWQCRNWQPDDLIDSAITGSGVITWDDQYVKVETGTTINSQARIEKFWEGYFEGASTYTWDKVRRFKAEILFYHETLQIIHLVSGDILDYTALANTKQHIGFKVENNTLYATVADGTTESTEDLGTFVSVLRVRLEAVLTPGVNCKFYKDGALVATITTNLPSGVTNAGHALEASIYNTEAAKKQFYLAYVSVLQEE